MGIAWIPKKMSPIGTSMFAGSSTQIFSDDETFFAEESLRIEISHCQSENFDLEKFINPTRS